MLKIPGTTTELFPGVDDDTAERVLAELCALYEAHQHTYTHVGRTGENKFTGSCSCGGWAVTAVSRCKDVRQGFDAHLAPLYADFAQETCFCGRLVFESPLSVGTWVHADYMGEFYGHDPLVLEK